MANLPALTDCKPGFVPTEFNVVIVVPDAETKTAGGIILLEKDAEAKQAAAMRGRLVAIAPLAGDGVWPKDGPGRPVPGDEVVFAKYGGTLITGDDGREYRLAKDKDIIAVCERKEA